MDFDELNSMAESIRNVSLQWRILPAIIALLVYLPIVSGSFFKPFNVSYDHRTLIIAGKRRMLVSAGIHYPRATPEVTISFTKLSDFSSSTISDFC